LLIAISLELLLGAAFHHDYLVVKSSESVGEIKTTELSKANEHYDIVARATSDTIWDWNIKLDHFAWNKEFKGIFGIAKTTSLKILIGGLKKFIQKTV
jgi:hypothetical protein